MLAPCSCRCVANRLLLPPVQTHTPALHVKLMLANTGLSVCGVQYQIIFQFLVSTAGTMAFCMDGSTFSNIQVSQYGAYLSYYMPC